MYYLRCEVGCGVNCDRGVSSISVIVILVSVEKSIEASLSMLTAESILDDAVNEKNIQIYHEYNEYTVEQQIFGRNSRV